MSASQLKYAPFAFLPQAIFEKRHAHSQPDAADNVATNDTLRLRIVISHQMEELSSLLKKNPSENPESLVLMAHRVFPDGFSG